MKRLLKKVIVAFLALSLFAASSTTILAAELDSDTQKVALQEGPPTEFAPDTTPQEMVAAIEAYYQSLTLTRASEKWGESETVYDGAQGYYVTTRFWVDGSNISSVGVVGKAETKAVKAKYGSVSKSYAYKLETTQHIVESATQIQGYITASASSTCYDRR